MPIYYDFYENPKVDQDEPTLYHPRAVTMRTVSTPELARDIQKATSLTESDVRACLAALSHGLQHHMSESCRVHLEGIGYFQLALEAPPTSNPKKLNAQSIRIKGVRYRADKELNGRMVEVKFERRSSLSNHSESHTAADIERLLMDYLSERGYITSTQLSNLCNLVPATARRHLARLRKEGKIENIGTRNAPIYQAVLE